jgi:hypothetical protein
MIEYYCRIDSPYEGKDGRCIGQNKCQVGMKFQESICPYIEMRVGFDPYIL